MAIKIAFGTSILNRGLADKGIDGIGYYCQELWEQLKNDSDLEILPFSFGSSLLTSNQQNKPDFLPEYSSYLIKKFMSDFLGPNLTNATNYFDRADLIHATDHLIPAFANKPIIATIQDTVPITHQQLTKSIFSPIKSYVWKKLIRNVAHIITASKFSKIAIHQSTNYSLDKITVIPHGVNPLFFESPDPDQIARTINRFSLPEQFFLHIGTIQPRKNLIRLIQAHANLPHGYAKQFPLVIAGKLGWDNGEIMRAINDGILNKRCRWISYISDLDKRCLLHKAIGLPLVSLHEGFGMAIVEAFASNLPVITSNITAMPEIADKSALLVDPLNTDAITNAMLLLIEDQNLCTQLKISGLMRAKEFTWEKTALKTSKVYQSMLF